MKPLKFNPLLKPVLWGGDKIAPFKKINTSIENIGESWEISGVPGDETLVSEGEYKGRSLSSLIEELKGKLIGEKNYKRFGTEFPLLVKFIDAKDDLSIQVHPTDELAHKRGRLRGKTEMWYILDSDKDAYLCCGLKEELTPEEYKKKVADNTITETLSRYDVKRDDSFFIPAGRIHSIGRGCFLLEIQQTSDVTYRIYDFNRRDKDGKLRRLHTEEAAECINYEVQNNYKTEYTRVKNTPMNLATCQYFTVNVYDINNDIKLNLTERDSFSIIVCTKGSGEMTDNEGNTISLNTGETILIPATTKTLNISGKMEIAEAFI